ncbi:MAG: hypothetical protein HY910_12080 [Desulfarculus sp.]|nr:hypothetical protein [Desulfarculus sp.]
MGAGAFTTWSDLARAMRDDLASGNFRTVSSYALPGGSGSITYRTMKEFLDLLSLVEQRASEETGGFDGQIITTKGGYR